MTYECWINGLNLQIPNNKSIDTEHFSIKNGEIKSHANKINWVPSKIWNEMELLLKEGIEGVIIMEGEERPDYFKIILKENKVYEVNGKVVIDYEYENKKLKGKVSKLEQEVNRRENK